LIASDHWEGNADETVGSDVPELDALLGGGIERGSSMLITGSAGVGKSTPGHPLRRLGGAARRAPGALRLR
jgi:circadian clock protein KaiC